jgi:hypothetical protein
MFRKKAAKEAPSQPTAQANPTPTYSGGYQVTELPTFHGRKRKVVVYTSDANGKIIKTIKH